MIPSTVASRARSIIVVARAGLPPRPSPSTYPSRSHYYFASDAKTLNSFGCHKFTRLASSSSSAARPSFDGPPGKNAAADSLQSSDGSSNNKQRQQFESSYGISNFRKMLQHQHFDEPQNSSQQRPKKSQTSERHDFSSRREKIVSSRKQEEGASKTKRTDEARPYHQAHDTNTNDNNGANANKVPHERHRWRNNPPSRPYKGNQAPNRPKTNADPVPKAATSDWILVSNVPPMSELSDLCQSLNEILDYEVEKGIIDLDVLDNLEEGPSDYATMSALKQIGALQSLYSTQRIDDGYIPLWTPSSSDHSHSTNHVCSMILEARIHLSFRARPMGWFLRLPNRSVVHAVLNHVRRAEDFESQRKLYLATGDEYLKTERREWREGLWRGVWAEHETEIMEKESREMLKDESEDEKELMWGDGLGEEEDDILESPFEEADEAIQAADVEEKQDDDDDYLQKYLGSNPYPIQSTEPGTTQKSQYYQLLKSGSTALNIKEFSPPRSVFSLPHDAHLSWEQHSFHLTPLLNLSDRMVRIETSVLRTTVDDIQFLFRGYDLDSISPVVSNDSTTPLPSCFTELTESLGWNMNSKGNVGCLVEGTHAPRQHHAQLIKDKDKKRDA